MPNPSMSLRHDQLILVNKRVSKKEQLKKGLEEDNFFDIYFTLIHAMTMSVT
jgi:hypothetical protein